MIRTETQKSCHDAHGHVLLGHSFQCQLTVARHNRFHIVTLWEVPLLFVLAARILQERLSPIADISTKNLDERASANLHKDF